MVAVEAAWAAVKFAEAVGAERDVAWEAVASAAMVAGTTLKAVWEATAQAALVEAATARAVLVPAPTATP